MFMQTKSQIVSALIVPIGILGSSLDFFVNYQAGQMPHIQKYILLLLESKTFV
jgi:hypothetical protein